MFHRRGDGQPRDGLPTALTRLLPERSPVLWYQVASDGWSLVWPCDACGGTELALAHRPWEIRAGFDAVAHRVDGQGCPGCETRSRRLARSGEDPEVWYDTMLRDWVVRIRWDGDDDGAILPLELRCFDAPAMLVHDAASEIVFAGDALCDDEALDEDL